MQPRDSMSLSDNHHPELNKFNLSKHLTVRGLGINSWQLNRITRKGKYQCIAIIKIIKIQGKPGNLTRLKK